MCSRALGARPRAERERAGSRTRRRRTRAARRDGPLNAAAVARGKSLFESSATGCTSCHSGTDLSTHAIVNVGTGGTFKVPSLRGVSYRAPFMHNGCAATLADRFSGACGGLDAHGTTSGLSTSDVQSIVAYLSTL